MDNTPTKAGCKVCWSQYALPSLLQSALREKISIMAYLSFFLGGDPLKGKNHPEFLRDLQKEIKEGATIS